MYTYEEIFQRNIGVFTPEEQEKIKNLKIAIAGAGGLGGPVAYYLARLGVGELRLADPEKFDETNINRQFGAYIDTVGQFKAEAIKNELLRINPHLVAKSWNEGIDGGNIDEFLDGADAVVDGIDFFSLNDANTLYKEAFKRDLWVFTSQAAKEILSFIIYNPAKGVTFEDMVCKDGQLDLMKAIQSFFPILPSGIKQSDIDGLVKSGAVHISSHATPPNIGGGLLVEEMIKVLVKGIEPTITAPGLFVFNLEKLHTTVFDSKITEEEV